MEEDRDENVRANKDQHHGDVVPDLRCRKSHGCAVFQGSCGTTKPSAAVVRRRRRNKDNNDDP
ncbi:hypothetical protein COOONC_04932 [Cooperia oncophora]